LNVFILSTGRCGSHTFVEACRAITTHTAGHETRKSMVGDERLAYPPDHIEADNRLSWFLGRLGDGYGDDAYYVHLMRDEEATARSFVARYDRGVMLAYRKGIITGAPASAQPMDMALDYVRTVNRNIVAFLRDKTHVMDVHLESARDDFRTFWDWIGAEGDLDAALAEWDVRHDATPAEELAEELTAEQFAPPVRRRGTGRETATVPGEGAEPGPEPGEEATGAGGTPGPAQRRSLPVRLATKSMRIVRGLPAYLRGA
jgi:hypothetical protein